MSEYKGESQGFIWAYRDLLTAMMVVFMALGLLAVIAAQKIKNIEGVQPGQLFVQMTWASGSMSDIDLWIESPGDDPVGYARPAGKNCDLLRDDLGLGADSTSHAIELLVCRDPPAGEYVVNVMDYSIHSRSTNRPLIEELPMLVTITISRTDNKNGNGHMKTLISKKVILEHVGQELTAVRFELNADHNIVDGSINELPKMIRTRK